MYFSKDGEAIAKHLNNVCCSILQKDIEQNWEMISEGRRIFYLKVAMEMIYECWKEQKA